MREAYDLADYLLLLDADHILEIKDENFKNKLDKDVYSIKQRTDTTENWVKRIVSTKVKPYYSCPTHEYLTAEKKMIEENLEDIFINDIMDGGCKENKYSRDIEILKKALSDPKEISNVGRILFYLGQSYYDIGEKNLAIKYMLSRIKVGGWKEEIYICFLRLGRINDDILLKKEYFLKGYQLIPDRAECLYELNCLYMRDNMWSHVKDMLDKKLNFQKYILFRETYIETNGLNYQRALSSYKTGKIEEGLNYIETLLDCPIYGESACKDMKNFSRLINYQEFKTKELSICYHEGKKYFSIRKEDRLSIRDNKKEYYNIPYIDNLILYFSDKLRAFDDNYDYDLDNNTKTEKSGYPIFGKFISKIGIYTISSKSQDDVYIVKIGEYYRFFRKEKKSLLYFIDEFDDFAVNGNKVILIKKGYSLNIELSSIL